LRLRETAIDDCARRLALSPGRALDRASRLVDAVESQVHAFDPARTLARGWSITHDRHGTLVRSVADVAPGSDLVTTVADGELRSTVDG
jgi:exodeoxyribonuclease VII large subunit